MIKAVQRPIEGGGDEMVCEMCGAAFNLADGTARPSESKGNPLLGGLLRQKPQKNMLVFPTKELADGSVYVNINQKTVLGDALDEGS